MIEESVSSASTSEFTSTVSFTQFINCYIIFVYNLSYILQNIALFKEYDATLTCILFYYISEFNPRSGILTTSVPKKAVVQFWTISQCHIVFIFMVIKLGISIICIHHHKLWNFLSNPILSSFLSSYPFYLL